MPEEKKAKTYLDISMNVIGFCGWWGFAVGLQYSIIDNTIGFDNFMDYIIKREIERGEKIQQGD